MKPLSSKSTELSPPMNWSSRIAHEAICAFVTGIFCVVELLVFVTEWQAKKATPRARRSANPARVAKPELSPARMPVLER